MWHYSGLPNSVTSDTVISCNTWLPNDLDQVSQIKGLMGYKNQYRTLNAKLALAFVQAYLTGLRKGQQKNNLMHIENLATLGTFQRFLGQSAELCVDFGTEYQFYWQVWWPVTYKTTINTNWIANYSKQDSRVSVLHSHSFIYLFFVHRFGEGLSKNWLSPPGTPA